MNTDDVLKLGPRLFYDDGDLGVSSHVLILHDYGGE